MLGKPFISEAKTLGLSLKLSSKFRTIKYRSDISSCKVMRNSEETVITKSTVEGTQKSSRSLAGSFLPAAQLS